jgi:hypothetical protein
MCGACWCCDVPGGNVDTHGTGHVGINRAWCCWCRRRASSGCASWAEMLPCHLKSSPHVSSNAIPNWRHDLPPTAELSPGHALLVGWFDASATAQGCFVNSPSIFLKLVKPDACLLPPAHGKGERSRITNYPTSAIAGRCCVLQHHSLSVPKFAAPRGAQSHRRVPLQIPQCPNSSLPWWGLRGRAKPASSGASQARVRSMGEHPFGPVRGWL